MNEETARKYAEEKFKQLPGFEYGWNMLHPKYMIKALEELNDEGIDLSRLKALAWVHDIGKIENMEDHAKLSVKILEKDFDLDEMDRECIINHGSEGTPKSKEAGLFQKADGISLFYPEMIMYRFWAESKEGLEFEEINAKLRKLYDKYTKVYSDSEKAMNLLKTRYEAFFR